MRGQHRQARHAHAAVTAFVDQRQAAHQVFIARKARADLFEPAAVDLVDDLHVPRQQRFEQRNRPGLERLGHQRVVGVADGLLRDLPGFVPDQALLVDQQAHQLGGHQRRVRVVQVHRVLAAEVVQRAAFAQMARQHVLQRRADEQELLLQAHLAAGVRAVVGVQHPVQHVGREALAARGQVLAAAEGGKVDRLLALRMPLAQRATRARCRGRGR